ncbi:MAG TPA: DUF4870 domain-containing protein [Flavobacteriaceae bacterium]|nr:DUF4870 domain-containing protein [Flavobacteriaceae bacterium]MCB9213841.1 DUF4870 domain-containing protein [Alteromonas sp.]HPF11237.1 DUF4870 domain-containing protein [Flavobacteriaceae bacterium]HQU21716.1 DUF4870 domain-containing protein [Flavobacteriaceae bacterium]HQU64544.1 DUF4870 domain-containing protein [Flavobacteriaceae bacterium]
METTPTENHKNIAALIHISTFTKYFFPLANFLAPLVLWSTNKEKPFVVEHGRQALNFQLSILLYSLAIGILCFPFFVLFAADFVSLIDAIDRHSNHITMNDIQNLSGLLILFFVAVVFLLGLFVFELYAVISATVHANRGLLYRYPLSISFIKSSYPEPVGAQNQSKNEHVS